MFLCTKKTGDFFGDQALFQVGPLRGRSLSSLSPSLSQSEKKRRGGEALRAERGRRKERENVNEFSLSSRVCAAFSGELSSKRLGGDESTHALLGAAQETVRHLPAARTLLHEGATERHCGHGVRRV